MAVDTNKSLRVVTRQLIEHLKRTNQLGIFPELVKESLNETKNQLSESTALVKTTYKLGASELTSLKKSLSDMYGSSVTIKNVVEPDIIAGIYIKIGDQIIDQTLRNEIDLLGESLSQ